MKSLILSLLASLPLVLGQTCSGNGATDPAAFQLTVSSDFASLTTLSEIFREAGKNVSVSDVLDSANRDLAKATPSGGNGDPSTALGFNSGDAATKKWIPQGVTGTWDAAASGLWEDREAFLISWHQDDDSNVRVSFVDKKTNKYRHVYLVLPDDDTFGSVSVHAGGIVWFQSWLYVVDTSVGIRVFDMSNIWEMDIGDGLGKQSDGTYTAENYAFVLPQIRYYKWTPKDGTSAFRHSWISLDRSDDPPTLLIGEFVRDDSDDIRLVKYPLNTDNGRLKANDKGVVTATEAYCVDFLRMQGGFSYDGTFILSRSNGRSPLTGDMFKWTPGEAAESHAGWFLAGNEDLSYNELTKEWFTVTEYDPYRMILGYDGM